MKNWNKLAEFILASKNRDYLIMFVLLTIIMAGRKFDFVDGGVFGTPYLWGEDAPVFLQRIITAVSQEENVLKIFTNIYAGYYHFVPQLVTLIGYVFSQLLGAGLSYTPYIMNYSALFYR